MVTHAQSMCCCQGVACTAMLVAVMTKKLALNKGRTCAFLHDGHSDLQAGEQDRPPHKHPINGTPLSILHCLFVNTYVCLVISLLPIGSHKKIR